MFVAFGFYFSLVCTFIFSCLFVCKVRFESDLKEVNSDFISVRASFSWCWHVINFLPRQHKMQSKT